MATQRNYRKFTVQQKLEIVLAGLRGDRSVKDVRREHEIAETLYHSWRHKLLEGGREQLAGKEERQGEKELKKRIRELERALGRKTYELEIAAGSIAGLGVSERVAGPASLSLVAARPRSWRACCRSLARRPTAPRGAAATAGRGRCPGASTGRSSRSREPDGRDADGRGDGEP